MNTIKSRIGFLALLALFGGACSDAGVVGEGGAAQFSLDPQGLTLAIGETATIQPASKSNGRAVNPRSLKWVSTNTASVTVTSDGVVRGVAVGQALVVASSGNLADTTYVKVVPPGPRLEVSPSPLTFGHVGEKTKLTAVLKDGTTTTTPQVTWRSVDANVVQVDSMGNATARAVGATMIIATSVCCGQADTAHARVGQVVSAVTVEPASATVPMGSSLQLISTVTDAGGGVMSGSVTWTSDNEAVATVSSTGLVTPVAPGAAVIRATSGTASGTSNITVGSGTPLAPAAGGEIQLTLHRLRPGTGVARVSTGILLQPGQLRDTGVGSVSVTVGGTEVSAYVEALHGRHRDGSVVSVLVQFDADPATQKDATLRLNAAPTRPRLAKQVVDFRPGATLTNVIETGYPAVVALPPVSHMTQAFSIFGPTSSVAEAQALGGMYSKFESDFVDWSARKWTELPQHLASGNPRERLMGVNYYDRGYHHLAWLHRSGNPEYFRRGASYTFNYRYHTYEYYNYAVTQERLWLAEGLALHYWLTGDEESRNAVLRLAQRAGGSGTWNYLQMQTCNYKGEARPVARSLSVLTYARLLGYPEQSVTVRQYLDRVLDGGVDRNLWRNGAWVYKHPDFPTGAGCSVEYVSHFMVAMILDALITYYDRVEADPRIPAAVQRSLDYLLTQWVVSSGSPSIKYYDVVLSGSGGPDPAVDLNGFYVHVFAWAAKHTGQQKYATAARDLFSTLSKWPDGKQGPWLTGDKQFNETYQKAWQISAYRF